MIDDMSDNGKIYKYYSYNDYSLDVLRNNQLFFSHPSNFNDPFDSSFNLLVKPYKKFCDALHGIKNMSNAFEKQGIGCFTKSNKPDNKHFWSLYAGNYSGFALEFDEDELNNLYEIFAIKVAELRKAKKEYALYEMKTSNVTLERKKTI